MRKGWVRDEGCVAALRRALAAAVAGLMAEIGADDIRLGQDGYIVSHRDGCLAIDGEPVADRVTAPSVLYGEDF